ncbi:Dip2/Utp12 family-domain-containing protein [Xylariaceae sp. FL0016]|nr:Dip2/Utp12 family-domain-containing protein [Xylariaceae sp. FL0016]
MSAKRKAPPNHIAQPIVKRSAKQPLNANINESEAAVFAAPETSKAQANGATGELIEISSDSGSSDYDDSDAEETGKPEVVEQGNDRGHDQPKTQQGEIDNDVDMAESNAPNDAESDQEPAQPTLGELARAVHDTIDVHSALAAPTNTLTTQNQSLAPPSSSSLGTVLSQALRTDDTDLLESCLHMSDLQTIRNTIQRLDSTLAGTLLTKLAARMHRRPGRCGSLMTWVQWTLISHGGALATQPDLMKRLSELHRVLEDRSRGLTSLLALKGKLDMLKGQMELRQGMQRNLDSDDEDEEKRVIYVEGEDSDSEVVNGLVEDDDELMITNGVDGDSDEEDISSEEDEVDELEGPDELDENDVNHEDLESDEEDSEAEAIPQPPVKKSRSRR